MVKVIETSISVDDDNNIFDHQSRVVEVESWSSYLEEYQRCESVYREDAIGTLMSGVSLPKKCKISKFECDATHAMCHLISKDGWQSKKLMYLIR